MRPNDPHSNSALESDQRHLMANIRLAQLHERRGEFGDATTRWAGVAALAAEHPNARAELSAIFDHARAFVATRNQQLSDAFATELAGDLAAASTRDQRRIGAAIDVMLGRRQVYTNQCFGLHYPFLPADEFFDREHFPWLAELESHTEAIRAEVVALLASDDPGLSPYVTMPPGTPRNVWTDLNHSAAWSALHLWRDGERIDEACARAPKTATLVEKLPLATVPGRAPTVFFSILQAGKHIPPHTGVTNTRTIIHLPLIVPPGCAFRVGGETREWREGEAFAFDDTIEHEAWNRSDQDRAVLILDCWNPHLSEHERRDDLPPLRRRRRAESRGSKLASAGLCSICHSLLTKVSIARLRDCLIPICRPIRAHLQSNDCTDFLRTGAIRRGERVLHDDNGKSRGSRTADRQRIDGSGIGDAVRRSGVRSDRADDEQ